MMALLDKDVGLVRGHANARFHTCEIFGVLRLLVLGYVDLDLRHESL